MPHAKHGASPRAFFGGTSILLPCTRVCSDLEVLGDHTRAIFYFFWPHRSSAQVFPLLLYWYAVLPLPGFLVCSVLNFSKFSSQKFFQILPKFKFTTFYKQNMFVCLSTPILMLRPAQACSRR